jgi:hypothetical protein
MTSRAALRSSLRCGGFIEARTGVSLVRTGGAVRAVGVRE